MNHVKIIINGFLPFKPYQAMAFRNFIFVRNDVTITKTLIAHELVHVHQYRRDGLIKFLFTWLTQFLFRGYKNISYEKEAYAKQYYTQYQNWASTVLELNRIEDYRER